MPQALQIDGIADKFRAITAQIEEALCKVHYDRFDIPEEVREQVCTTCANSLLKSITS